MKYPKILYHYCSLETFEKIIKNHTIRFSDITKSNDSDEIKFTINCYYKFLDMANEFAVNKNLVEQFLKNQIDDKMEYEKTYCFCMSGKKDLLSQWRGYAPNGGIAIGFNYKKLNKYIKEKTLILQKQIKLDKVNYVSKDNPKEIIDMFKELDNSQPINNFTVLLEYSILNKNKGFKEEQEYRMYFKNFVKSNFSNQPLPDLIVDGKKCELNYQIHNSSFKTYYDVPITLDLIDEIIIGPKLQISPDLLKSFLTVYGKDEIDFNKLNIELTKLTYR